MGYNLFRGLTTYLYWGYNPATKYHGHPSNGRTSLHVLRSAPGPTLGCWWEMTPRNSAKKKATISGTLSCGVFTYIPLPPKLPSFVGR